VSTLCVRNYGPFLYVFFPALGIPGEAQRAPGYSVKPRLVDRQTEELAVRWSRRSASLTWSERSAVGDTGGTRDDVRFRGPPCVGLVGLAQPIPGIDGVTNVPGLEGRKGRKGREARKAREDRKARKAPEARKGPEGPGGQKAQA
jgi:hypothetical protein